MARLVAMAGVPGRAALPYVIGLAVRGLEVVGKLGLYVFAGRALGGHDAGLFFLCITWAAFLAPLARCGFERPVTRHVAAELAVGNRRAARRALGQGLAWSGLAGLAAALLTFLLANPAARLIFGTPDLGPALRICALVLLPQTLSGIIASGLGGIGRVVSAQLVQNSLWPLLSIGFLLAGANNLRALQLGVAAAYLLSCLLGAGLLASRAAWNPLPAPAMAPPEALPGLWQAARPLMVAEILQAALNTLPILALGVVARPEDVASFSMASRISILVWVVIVSIGTMSSPVLARFHHLGDAAGLRGAVRAARHMVWLLGLPLAGAMLAAPGRLLALLGAAFVPGAPALAILALGQAVACVFSCQDVLLVMSGNGLALRRITLLQVGACLVLGLALMPRFGMLGAAVAVATATGLGAGAAFLAARRLVPQAF